MAARANALQWHFRRETVIIETCDD